METHNNTDFPNIQDMFNNLLHPIKHGVNNWRQRRITLFEHPHDASRVISVGVTFDEKMTVIADESKQDWRRELAQPGNFVTN